MPVFFRIIKKVITGRVCGREGKLNYGVISWRQWPNVLNIMMSERKSRVFRTKVVGKAQSVQNVKFRGLRTAVNHFTDKGYEWIHYSLHTCLQILSQNMKRPRQQTT